MSKAKVLQAFFNTIFTENCRCFQATCDIDTESPQVKTLLAIFRELQNRKSCSTFFDRQRLDFGGTIQRQLNYMIQLGLLEKRKDGPYRLANGLDLSWVALQTPHSATGPCFCAPLQESRTDLDRLMEYVRGPNCKIFLRCPALTGDHIHELARCVFWFFRKSIVDNLIHYSFTIDAPNVASRISDEPTNTGTCHAVSVGSMRITSDYDVTLYGTCVSNVSTNFNRTFFEIFKKSAATTFDSNVYGSSFLETSNITEFDAPAKAFYDWIDCSTTEYDEEPYFYVKSSNKLALNLVEGKITPEQMGDLPSTVTQQHIWALLKLKRSLNSLVMPKSRKEKQNQNKRPNEAEFRMQSLLNQIHAVLHRIAPLRLMNAQLSKISTPTPIMITNVQSETVPAMETRSFTQDLIQSDNVSFEIARQADQFWKTLTTAEDVVTPTSSTPPTASSPISPIDFTTTKDVDYGELPFELIRNSTKYGDLLNVISTFNFFGDETYFTRGAFMNVVFGLQTCKGKFTDMTAHDYLDSFVENFADCIHHHFKPKYVLRMYTAINAIQESAQKTATGSFANLLGFLKGLQGKTIFSDSEKYELVERSFHFILMSMTDWAEGVSFTDQVARILQRAQRVVTYMKQGR